MCQGSAADIIKIAMINIYSAISEDIDTAASSSSTETRFHVKEAAMLLGNKLESEGTGNK